MITLSVMYLLSIGNLIPEHFNVRKAKKTGETTDTKHDGMASITLMKIGLARFIGDFKEFKSWQLLK